MASTYRHSQLPTSRDTGQEQPSSSRLACAQGLHHRGDIHAVQELVIQAAIVGGGHHLAALRLMCLAPTLSPGQQLRSARLLWFVSFQDEGRDRRERPPVSRGHRHQRGAAPHLEGVAQEAADVLRGPGRAHSGAPARHPPAPRGPAPRPSATPTTPNSLRRDAARGIQRRTPPRQRLTQRVSMLRRAAPCCAVRRPAAPGLSGGLAGGRRGCGGAAGGARRRQWRTVTTAVGRQRRCGREVAETG